MSASLSEIKQVIRRWRASPVAVATGEGSTMFHTIRLSLLQTALVK